MAGSQTIQKEETSFIVDWHRERVRNKNTAKDDLL